MISFTMSILLLAVINEVLLASAVLFKHKPPESKNFKIEKVEEIITRICPLFTIPELCVSRMYHHVHTYTSCFFN